MLVELESRSWKEAISGPWLRPSDLEPYFDKWSGYEDFEIDEVGRSEEGRSLRTISWGQGEKTILLWSQMHGNEATATLAIIDLIEFFNFLGENKDEELSKLATKLRILFIPMLNPDGAELYTRRNALLVDMNRDAVRQQSSEIQAFFRLVNREKPDWAFNLHDQRSIFSVGKEVNCATLSYLAPSPDSERSITKNREKSMKLVAAMHQQTKHILPLHFGRYTDEFYPRALGDNLMAMDIPCILLEAGAYANDPRREKARDLIFKNLVFALNAIAHDQYADQKISDYDAIPENQQLLRAIILRGVLYRGQSCDIALQERQLVTNDKKWQQAYILDDLGDLSHLKGVKEFQGGTVELIKPLALMEKVNFKYTKGLEKIEIIEGSFL
jgi:hypothetical protein